MKNRVQALAIAVTMGCMGFGQELRDGGNGDHVPTFQDYPAEQLYEGKVALPKFHLGDPDKYSFPDSDLRCIGVSQHDRTLFFGDKHVNFAGRYILDACTCGTGCHYLFMWDAQSGKLFRKFSFGVVVVGPYFEGKKRIEYSGEHYRVDSTLLIVEGCLDSAEHSKRRACARYFYNWTGENFVRVFKQSL
jgi:hypothetical protein